MSSSDRYNVAFRLSHAMSSFPELIDNKTAVARLFQAALFSAFPSLKDETPPFEIAVEKPKNPDHGHFAVNSALHLAKKLGKKPRDVAEAIIAALPESTLLASTPEIAGPGFINVRLSREAETRVINAVVAMGNLFGTSTIGNREKVMVEFVSANPTGPLHVGHGRGAAIGDTLARLLISQGYDVKREFYYNDAGAQINNLATSVIARLKERAGMATEFPEDGYRGDYIKEIAERYATEATEHANDAAGENVDAVRLFAVAALRHEQDLDLKAFDVQFDQYFLESSIYTDGLVEKTVNQLIANGHTYEEGGALWLRTTQWGDDKDRVMRKSDGTYTYFVPDIAYHVTKWQRGFTRAITELGADHHGSLMRVKAGLQAMQLGVRDGYPDYVLHQMITVMRAGAEVKISKRAGSYVTLRDLIDEVGRDATRYFFIMRKSDSQLTFDIDLAKSRSEDNPVYYVQYAHARICRVLEQWGGDVASLTNVDLSPLASAYESELLRTIADFPETLSLATRELSPHIVANYLGELAAKLHTYYNAERFLIDDAALKQARLALIVAVRQVIRNGSGRFRCIGTGENVIMAMDIKPKTSRMGGSGKPGMNPLVAGIIIGVIIGVFLALGIAIWLNRAATPFVEKTKPSEALSPMKSTSPTNPAAKTDPADPNKQRFEFYKILPGEKEPNDPNATAAKKPAELPAAPAVPAKDAKAAVSAVPPKDVLKEALKETAKETPKEPPKSANEVIFLQAGAFQSESDADTMKAKVAFAGFESNVKAVNVAGKGTLYRVRLGPYKSQDEVNRIKNVLSQNGISAAVVKPE